MERHQKLINRYDTVTYEKYNHMFLHDGIINKREVSNAEAP